MSAKPRRPNAALAVLAMLLLTASLDVQARSLADTAGQSGPSVVASKDEAAATPVEVLLAAHNRYRYAAGVPPLRWSAKLATAARDWAQRLAVEDRFEHSPHGHDEPLYGENLASSTGEPTAGGLVDLWGAEQDDYIPGARFPNVARNGDWATVGHYTQLVWRDTQEVGCGIWRGREATVLVCRYAPAGNWIGELPY